MKYIIPLLCLALSGCIPALTQEQAMVMPPATLCTHKAESPIQYQAIQDRKINCQKIVAAEAKIEAKRMPVDALCEIWFRRPVPYAVAAINAEVKSRKLDCAAIEGNRQAIEAANQAARQAQYQAALQQQQYMNQMNYQNQMQMIQNNQIRRSNNINCTSSTYGQQTYTNCY